MIGWHRRGRVQTDKGLGQAANEFGFQIGRFGVSQPRFIVEPAGMHCNPSCGRLLADENGFFAFGVTATKISERRAVSRPVAHASRSSVARRTERLTFAVSTSESGGLVDASPTD